MTDALIVSGHLVDVPGRTPPRFPQKLVGAVTAAMSAVFDAWGVGPGTTVICGGARGADIIGAEQGLLRGAAVRLCLALPPQQFARRSVDLPGTDWHERFERLCRRADVAVLPEEAGSGDEVFARTNEWMVRLAHHLALEPRAVVVWDGKAGDGAGGTSDLVRLLGYDAGDERLHIIDPCS
ncbi:hypothetical protein MF672_031550 [Actinomadura sp. ATCC 31491]|uniref:DUF2493 domain-containing protein n=1 Tax=Actinomadura luzonensis TaxID=2805427 RepID=A0ABT0G2E7_9ACTN|nr:hypothetical protein [Actinomadura luzonensis]MCK2218293.1 hypothetical protein [Actinomadura luzonensis]